VLLIDNGEYCVHHPFLFSWKPFSERRVAAPSWFFLLILINKAAYYKGEKLMQHAL